MRIRLISESHWSKLHFCGKRIAFTADKNGVELNENEFSNWEALDT